MGYAPTHRRAPERRSWSVPSRPIRPRLLAGAAVCASALAGLGVPVVTGPAGAATQATWDRLARCESGGRWHVDSGNGYYGGLQFSLGTWRGYGGRRFANYPHRASRRQQIVVGERVLNGQGWDAWPACSDQLNLGPEDARDKLRGRGLPLRPVGGTGGQRELRVWQPAN